MSSSKVKEEKSGNIDSLLWLISKVSNEMISPKLNGNSINLFELRLISSSVLVS
jgi:hypothetical protein